MYELPKEPGQIRERIRRCQRKLRTEKSRSGRIDDGAGKRYLLGPLFSLLGDLDNALNCFRWLEAEFPDDGGEPGHHLCWALALYRGGDQEAAARKLQQTMLMNLYLIPHLLGQKAVRIEMWHGSSDAEPGYLEEIPFEFSSLWDEDAQQWAAELYHSPPIRLVLSQFIEIHQELLHLPTGPRRTRLVTEAFSLRK
jgi:tetratricopeptide (TPR) repeat protein